VPTACWITTNAVSVLVDSIHDPAECTTSPISCIRHIKMLSMAPSASSMTAVGRNHNSTILAGCACTCQQQLHAHQKDSVSLYMSSIYWHTLQCITSLKSSFGGLLDKQRSESGTLAANMTQRSLRIRVSPNDSVYTENMSSHTGELAALTPVVCDMAVAAAAAAAAAIRLQRTASCNVSPATSQAALPISCDSDS
jgi:hypothetical protein